MKTSQTTCNKKTRTARASQVQLTKMIDYFYLNKGLAEGKFNALHGKEDSQKKWAELAIELNSYQGATKTGEQWQVVWRDLKSRTSIKVRDLRKAKGLTGNKAILKPELTEFEQRVIGIIGSEYVEGNNTCADSIPEEENVLEELERGNNAPLSEIPKVISVCSNISQNISEDMEYLDGDDFNTNDENVYFVDENVSNTRQILLERNDQEHHNAAKNLDKRESRKAQKHVAALSFRTNRNRAKLPEQLYSSREYFQSIALKQADAEMMHAESAKDQAEASKTNALAVTEIAQAVKKMADVATLQAINDSERIRVFEKLTTVLENLLPTYLQD